MLQAFKDLFSIQVQHQFSDGFRAVDVFPTPETVQSLKNHQLVWKQLDAGLRVVARVNANGQATALSGLTTPLKLAFNFRITSQDFWVYTDRFLASMDQALIAGNVGTKHTLPTDAGKSHLFSDSVSREDIQPPLSQGDNGRIEICINDPEVPDNMRLTDGEGNIQTKTYSLFFAARKTYWQYHLFLNGKNVAEEIHRFSIQARSSDGHAHEPIGFTPPATGSTNGQESIECRSQSHIQLSERYSFNIHLQDKEGLYNLQLPTPGTEMVRPDNDNPDICYSDMYIYL
ncbi:MAG: hypothetical protein AAF206_23035 [Bacteroidota bacterium]